MSDVEDCVRALRRGEVVAAPTDTFFGLLADPRSEAALAKLSRLKQSGDFRPWPLLLPESFDLQRIECTLSAAGLKLARRFWPGKVTLIVPCSGELAQKVGRASDGAVGLREPGGPPPLSELLHLWDGPLTGTSANPQGSRPAVRDQDVRNYFGSELGGIIPGETPGGMASTVVDTLTEPVSVIRKGEVSEAMILSELQS